MSSPIPIPSRTSSALYVPVHRRSPGSYTSSSSRAPSPSPSSSISISPSSSPTPMSLSSPIPGVYSPTELLFLSSSPLSKLSAGHIDAHLRATAPEVMQTRKQRKAQAWHAHNQNLKHSRTLSRGSHTSESEEDRATSWRRP